MAKRINKKLVTLGFITFLWILVISAYVQMHENAHEQIFNRFGCDQVRVNTNLLTPHATCLDADHDMTSLESELHIWNDIVGYHFVVILVMVFVVFVFLMVRE